MEDPVSRHLVLPLARLEQVAHHGHRSRTPHALRSLRALRETEHLVAARDEDLDQLEANESVGSGNKRGRPRVACHVASVGWQRAAHHRQDPHRTRTTPVRLQR